MFPISRQLFRNLPWFETTILTPIYDNGFRFQSDQHIAEFRAPVMILHAENDRVIPFELGYQLYRTALETRGKSWGPAEFHRFEGKYGHKHIVKAKSFADTIDQFIKRYKSESYWMDFPRSVRLRLQDDELFINFPPFTLPFVDIICNLPHHLLQYTARLLSLYRASRL